MMREVCPDYPENIVVSIYMNIHLSYGNLKVVFSLLVSSTIGCVVSYQIICPKSIDDSSGHMHDPSYQMKNLYMICSSDMVLLL